MKETLRFLVCFLTFLSFAYAEDAKNIDLLLHGRQLAKSQGMDVATRTIFDLVQQQDDSPGQLENELIQSGMNANFAVANALRDAPISDRPRISFLFINGLLQTEKSLPGRILRRAVEVLRGLRFSAEIVSVPPDGGSLANGKFVADFLRKHLPDYDRVYITTISKGTRDLLTALTDFREQIDREEFKKVDSVLSLSGVIRPSRMSQWFKNSNRLLARFTRRVVRTPWFGGSKALDAITSLVDEPVLTDENLELVRMPRWIQVLAFPDLKTGWPKMPIPERFILRSILASKIEIGPYDGLLETAASLFPPGLGIQQSVVRCLGPHGGVAGTFSNGQKFLPSIWASDPKKQVLAADELIDRCLRVLRFVKPA